LAKKPFGMMPIAPLAPIAANSVVLGLDSGIFDRRLPAVG
jgi:hypothetical protein